MIPGLEALEPARLAPLFAEHGLDPRAVRALDAGRGRALLAALGRGVFEPAALAPTLLDRASEAGAEWLFVHCAVRPPPASLARLRETLWPAWHAVALYEIGAGATRRETVEGSERLAYALDCPGVLVVLRAREAVLAPDTTARKFDRNAAAWNGEPGRPGYAHFRWMRRFVAELAAPVRARRILDFGAGAGWVGIEAALLARAGGVQDVELAAFDPSPEMLRIAGENARGAGLARFEGRTGFGEDPPFPAAGEAPFELVLSSGVASFAREREAWFDGLARTVAPGGTLVIGDLNPLSRGLRRRRAERALLPVREMNALTREEARAALEARGFRFERWCGYQLSDPLPQLLHLDRRLGGAFGPLLGAWNRRAAARSLRRGGAGQDRFDSWAMRLARGPAAGV
jgi:SAM-dependent methyltransferase